MRQKYYLYAFILLVITYIVLALSLPVDPEALKRYSVTQNQLRLLALTIIVPFTAVWFSALYGFLRFKAYSYMVKDSKEGVSFNRLADGLMVLAYGLPLSAIISSLLNYFAMRNADLLPTTTIWRNYIGLLLMATALLLIAKGAEGLVKTLKTRSALTHPRYTAIFLIILSSTFTWLIMAPSGEASSQMAYHLPQIVIIATLAIPYLFIWYMGALAAYRLHVYKDRIRSRVYKLAYGDLARGIGVIVGISILIQLLTTLTPQINRLNLTPVLLLIYLLVTLYAVGFGLVARGAKKLKKIEEV